MRIETQLPREYLDILNNDYLFTCLYGGRGGAKTCCVAEMLIVHMLSQTERGLVYCCLRETQKTLRDSSKAVIMSAIKRLGLDRYFSTSRTSDEIQCLLNDGVFKFRGIGTMIDVDKFKSIDNVRYAWIDEAHSIKAEIWEVFAPSVRRNDAQIIVTFNPRKKTDFIYEEFVINPSRFSKVYNVNYYNNPWFFGNRSLVTQMQDCYERYPDKFKHVWLGGTSSGFGQILNPNWWCRYEDVRSALSLCTSTFITADTAFKTKQHNDYSVLQFWGYNRNDIYLLNQVRGKWEFPDLVRKFKTFAIESTNMSRLCPPSKVYIEDKASGISLVQTLKNEGMQSIVPWKPKNFRFPDDKVGRAKEASVFVERGCCYVPTNDVASWARGFINECSDFDPEEDGFDDQVDAMTMAMSIFKAAGGGMITNNMRQ